MNQDLTGALRSAASSIDIPEGDLEGVIVTARRRNRNKRRIGTAFTSIVLLVALVVTISVVDRSDNPTTLKVGSGSEEPKGPGGALDWQVQDVSQLGMIYGSEIAEISDRLYAISTGPGEKDMGSPRVVWRSDDAINWSPVPISNSPSNYFSDLTVRGDRLYAAGTITADAKTTMGRETYSPVVAWSDDEAKTWEHVQLPVDMADIAAHSLYTSTYVTLASDSKNVLATVDVSVTPSLKTLLPPGTDYSNGWALSPHGIDLLKPGPGGPCPEGSFPSEVPPPPAENDFPRYVPCYTKTEMTDASGKIISSSMWGGTVSAQDYYGVEASYTWEQLGVKEDLVTAFTNQTFLFRISGDGSVTRLKGPKADDIPNLGSMKLAGSPDGGFVLAGSDIARGKSAFFTSSDGSDWLRKPDMPGPTLDIQSLGAFDKGFAVSGPVIGGVEPPGPRSLVMMYEDAKEWTSWSVSQGPDGALEKPEVSHANFKPNSAVIVDRFEGSKSSMITYSRGNNSFSSYGLEDITGLERLHYPMQVFATENGAIVLVSINYTDGKFDRWIALIGTYKKTRRYSNPN